METVPADVLIARAVRAHTRALVTLAAACVVLAGIGTAALSLAGEDLRTPPITAGLSVLGVAQVCALVAAGIAGLGLLRVLREVGEPGSHDSAAAVRSHVPVDAIRRTAARFAILMRVIVGACVLVIAVWAVADAAGIIGAVIGAVVTLQLVVALAVLRVHLLRSL
ncbi:hypothetical protein [Pseudactinotalea suaedae]|uniref:hypothetical protein n=1 Tax=Pseudactinotalea suaedae TaxID=1524924 RepID=UPI0012E1EBDB|nr:hypothetical protein [Pseudactinotalea suaedae]